jgi:IS30 family transposase
LQLKEYKQLSHEERVKIAQLFQQKHSRGQIAEMMARDKSTISRELKRNEAPPGQYWPDTAQGKALKRRRRGCLLDRDAALRIFVEERLRCNGWTPEQIAGYLKHRQRELKAVCHETIYLWIYSKGQRSEKLWKCLPRHKSKRGLRKSRGAGFGRIPGRVSIHERPAVVAEGKEFGHWEGDLMSFKKNSQHILVARERITLFTLSTPLQGKRAIETARDMTKLLKRLPQAARKTMTVDNGGEFAAHTQWNEDLGMATFFCDPYASWQKGGIENTNGRLRRDLPRNTNIQTMNQKDFDECIDNYNHTPRKKLGWQTPFEVFKQNLQGGALQT